MCMYFWVNLQVPPALEHGSQGESYGSVPQGQTEEDPEVGKAGGQRDEEAVWANSIKWR